jgi:hypothetical protein
MTPFYSRFPELAARETRCLHVLEPGGTLPVGEYGFIEHYCEDPACDCRRVVLRVTSAESPHTVLATINYGWESADFYTRWMHGDEQAGEEITAASLDPLNPQSQYADYLLDYFQEAMITDPSYVARLARHYNMFKAAQRGGKEAADTTCPPMGHNQATPAAITVPEILKQLQNVPDRADFAPYEAALKAATEQHEAITPELIAAIDRVSENPAPYLQKDSHDWLHHFALLLLAQFRETRALDCILRFFSLPGETALDLTGDMITEQGATVLASVCDGDPAPLLRLANDESINMFVRTQSIDGLLVQRAWGERPREAVIEDLRGLFSSLAKPGDDYVWAGLICSLCDFDAVELLPEGRRAFEEGLVDETVIRPESMDELEHPETRRFALPPGQTEFDLFRESHEPIDAVAECSAWLCFRTEEDYAGIHDWEDEIEEDDHQFARAIAYGDKPYTAPPKVGRNDPCPCGSGKKYKKCCGKN